MPARTDTPRPVPATPERTGDVGRPVRIPMRKFRGQAALVRREFGFTDAFGRFRGPGPFPGRACPGDWFGLQTQ